MIEFFIPMKPPTITHQEKKTTVKNNKPYFYDLPELKTARAKLTAHLGKHAPSEKLTGPLQLCVKWCFEIKGAHHDGEYKISKPDTDNLQKMLKDVMTDVGFWKDDAQVASEVVEKFWAEIPGLYIAINKI